MLKGFKNALLAAGYKEYTPAGNPSTVSNYIKGIEDICKRESLTFAQLASNISSIEKKYDFGGSEEVYGSKCHRTIYCALDAFKEFVTTGKIRKKR